MSGLYRRIGMDKETKTELLTMLHVIFEIILLMDWKIGHCEDSTFNDKDEKFVELNKLNDAFYKSHIKLTKYIEANY
jgi:hypothetical protein